MVSDAFASRPLKKLCLFDVDGTLTPARQVCTDYDSSSNTYLDNVFGQVASPEIIETLRSLRKKLVIGFVGGSDLAKITEQLQTGDTNSTRLVSSTNLLMKIISLLVLDEFDYAFAENGLTAFRLGTALPSQSFINFLGEERYKPFVNFILHYIADLEIPLKRWVSQAQVMPQFY